MIRRNRIRWIAACCLAMIGTRVSLAAVDVDEKRLREYAHSLAQRGEFKGAAEEYLRIATYLPKLRTDPEHIRTLLQFAEKSGDHEYAFNLIRYLSSQEKTGPIPCLTQYYKARVFYGMRRYPDAMAGLGEIKDCDPKLITDATYFKGLTYLRLRDWGRGDSIAGSLAEKNPDYQKKLSALVQEGKNKDFKSPDLATALSSAIPGAGYLYARSPMTGTAALVTTSLLAWGAYSLIDDGHETGGGILAAFAFSWHLGGIYGSRKAAVRYNNYLSDEYLTPHEIP